MELLLAPVAKTDVKAAGIAVRAADTGRVLMLQRSLADENDPVGGTWEFPGGKLDQGEEPYAAARREWEEEMGVALPPGERAGGWRHGVYQGFVHEVASEAAVPLNTDADDRKVINPDDPDCDNIEVAAWWDPAHLRGNGALRPELRASRVWSKVRKHDGGVITPGEAEALLVARRLTDTSGGATIEEDEARELGEHEDEVPDSLAQIPDPPAEIPLEKTTAHRLLLQVTGVHKDGPKHRYRLSTRDGHYVGMANPTTTRAVKGDVLVVEPNLFGRTEQGDFAWTNPNVQGHALGRAHGRRDLLEAMAGGNLAKDDAPDPGDTPTTSESNVTAPPLGAQGPTSNSVHVDAPLENLSVFYGGKRRKLEKAGIAEPMQQLIYGVVLEPNQVDSQGDIVTAAEVEKAAHRYLSNMTRRGGAGHREQHGPALFNTLNPKMEPVENFIAPVDFSYDGHDVIKKGSWVLVAKVHDKKLWSRCLQGYQDGEGANALTGWSVGGTGKRRSIASMMVGKADPVEPDRTAEAFERLTEALVKLADRPQPPITVEAPVTIAEGAVRVDVAPAQTTFEPGAIQVAAPEVHVEQPKPRPVRAETLPDGSRRYVPE